MSIKVCLRSVASRLPLHLFVQKLPNQDAPAITQTESACNQETGGPICSSWTCMFGCDAARSCAAQSRFTLRRPASFLWPALWATAFVRHHCYWWHNVAASKQPCRSRGRALPTWPSKARRVPNALCVDLIKHRLFASNSTGWLCLHRMAHTTACDQAS